jgi:hypothetical protein
VYGSTGTKISWQAHKALATDPALLVDTLALQLLNAPLPKALRVKFINAVSAVNLSATPTNTQLLDRVRMAAYLISVTPQFQVEY